MYVWFIKLFWKSFQSKLHHISIISCLKSSHLYAMNPTNPLVHSRKIENLTNLFILLPLFFLFQHNKMIQLSRITMENCPNVTKSVIDTILDSTNKVVLIRIWSCFLISKEDVDYLQKRIQKENCDTYLEWYSWYG